MPHPIDIIRAAFNITPEQAETLQSLMVEKEMPRRTVIENLNEIQNNTYYIMSGAARSYYTTNGKEHTVSFAFDDEYLITRLHTTTIQQPLTITFMTDSRVVYIPHSRMVEAFGGMAESHTVEAMMFFNAGFMKYMQYLEERIYILQSMNAIERYNWAINRYPRLLEYATITQIASFLGLTKETLYRIRSGKY